MIATLLAAAGLVLASAVLGQALLAVCGFSGWRWWAPGVGFAALLAIGAQTSRVPGGALGIVIVIALLLVAGLAVRSVRAALREAAPDGLPLGLAVLLIAALPFFSTGRAGILGVNVSNDMSAHLTAAYWLRTEEGLPPVGALGDNLLTQGYPLGPHGLTAALSHATGMSEAFAFSGLTLAVPVLTALAALAVLPGPRLGRWLVAGLAGLAYLVTAYLTQGSFKETIEALVLVATAVALNDVLTERRAGRLRRGVPLGVLAGGAVYAFSYPGALWPIGAALVLLAAEVVRRRGRVWGLARGAALGALGAALAFAVTAASDVGRMSRFAESSFSRLPEPRTGNLGAALSPFEGLGIWLVGDFRLVPDPAWPSYVLGALVLGALAGGLVWWWRRGALGPPAALVAGIVLWGQIALDRNAYASAKGLVILAPVVAVCAGAPLLAAWSARARSGRRRAELLLARGVGVIVLLGASASSFALLRDGTVGLGSQGDQLARLGEVAHGEYVLHLGVDHFAQWELRGAWLLNGDVFYTAYRLPTRPEKPIATGERIDVDNFAPSELDKADWIVAPDGHQSAMPPNFRLERETAQFRLYRRTGPTSPRVPLERSDEAGARLDCDSPEGEGALFRFRSAAVMPEPILLDQRVWRGQPVLPGLSGTARVRLPPGRWDVSLQYVSPTGLDVEAPGMRFSLPPHFGRINSYWHAGTVQHDGGELVLRATARPQAGIGRVLGTSRPTHVVNSIDGFPLNRLAFTRRGAGRQMVPVEQACGRWVDWYVPH